MKIKKISNEIFDGMVRCNLISFHGGMSLFKVLPQFNTEVEKAETVVFHNLDFDLLIVTTDFLR